MFIYDFLYLLLCAHSSYLNLLLLKDLYDQNAKHSKGNYPVSDDSCVKITNVNEL